MPLKYIIWNFVFFAISLMYFSVDSFQIKIHDTPFVLRQSFAYLVLIFFFLNFCETLNLVCQRIFVVKSFYVFRCFLFKCLFKLFLYLVTNLRPSHVHLTWFKCESSCLFNLLLTISLSQPGQLHLSKSCLVCLA